MALLGELIASDEISTSVKTGTRILYGFCFSIHLILGFVYFELKAPPKTSKAQLHQSAVLRAKSKEQQRMASSKRAAQRGLELENTLNQDEQEKLLTGSEIEGNEKTVDVGDDKLSPLAVTQVPSRSRPRGKVSMSSKNPLSHISTSYTFQETAAINHINNNDKSRSVSVESRSRHDDNSAELDQYSGLKRSLSSRSHSVRF